MTATASVSPTGNPYIDGLLSGIKWGTSNLTYSFPTSASYYEYGGEPGNNFKAFTAVQQDAVRKTLANYSAVANLTFTEITETSTQHATLRYAESDSPSTAWAYYPSTSAQGGDAWYGNSSHWYDNPIKGSYGYNTMLHETGHALGLKHPHEGSAMPLDRDSLEYSVMSYHSYIGSPTNGYTNGFYDGYPQTLMMYDIAAVQEMYGANFSTNGGDSVYKWSPVTGEMLINGVGQGAPGGNKIFMTVWDGGGHDTYDFSNYTTNLSVNLQPGEWSTASTAQLADLGGGHFAAGNIANALLYHGNTASLIEDVVGGSGNDTIVGNVANNHFTGGAGNDTLNGGAGTDTAIYAGHHDNFVWAENANGSWTVTDLTGAQGVDTLWNIESLQFGDTIVSIGTAPPVVTNAAPTITSAASKVSLTEWANNSASEVANTAHTATGAITYSDADLAQLHTASVKPQGTNYLGTFSLNTNNIDSNQSVGWSFTVSDSAVDYLKAGQTLSQNYNVTIDDGHGGTTMQTVTVTLVGADDGTTTTTASKGRGKPAKGNDPASDDHGNDMASADHGNGGGHFTKSDVLSLLDMMRDHQAPAPYQLQLPDSVHLPEAALSALAHISESIWHV